MDQLAIDIETYSEVDLKKSGVYAYAESPTFEILLFAYAVDQKPVQIVDLACGEVLPPEILSALTDDSVIKTAYNAQFERICLSCYFHLNLSPASWRCTQIQASILTLPQSLEAVGEALNLKLKKLKSGEALIRYWSKPCSPTKANGGRTRNLPEHNPEKWEMFKTYCVRDVETEREIRNYLTHYPISDQEQIYYTLDQEINDRGVLVDLELVNQAVACDQIFQKRAKIQAQKLTGLSNPNSIPQIKNWLGQQGLEVESLDKKALEKLKGKASGKILEILNLRQMMSKSSVKKYQAVQRAVSSDQRVRGLFKFYGANRTGRWAGRLVQLQNLPQNHLPDLELARNLVRSGDFETLELLFPSVPGVLSELIRTAFIPKPGCRFLVADFSAIEARVLAWLAGERWRLETFKKGGDIYCASASKMFGIPVEKHGVNSHLRQKGKISELALGYGGSVGALTAMGALDMGLTTEELNPLVNQWRNANPFIVNFWDQVGAGAFAALEFGRFVITINSKAKIEFYRKKQILFIVLPSGRKLAYFKPKMTTNRFGGASLSYMGIDFAKKWSRLETYGAKLVENIVQAISRDLLAYSLLNLKKAGLHTVIHVHDEAVLEVPENEFSLPEVCQIMTKNPPWAEGLPLDAAGFECRFYQKD